MPSRAILMMLGKLATKLEGARTVLSTGGGRPGEMVVAVVTFHLGTYDTILFSLPKCPSTLSNQSDGRACTSKVSLGVPRRMTQLAQVCQSDWDCLS